jgi:hypothetical protein
VSVLTIDPGRRCKVAAMTSNHPPLDDLKPTQKFAALEGLVLA